MKRISYRAVLALSLAALATTLGPASTRPAFAVVTATWELATYKDWDKGEADGTFITSLGELKPGWGTKRIALDFDNVWAAVRASDGAVYLGTDDEGKIYKLVGDKATELAQIPDVVAVTSLALATDGMLYAGTMPEGQVWRIDTKSGQATKVVTLEETETVWALALSKDERELYAGTGPNGKLFRIDVAKNTAALAFDTKDKRIMALAPTRDGAIWLGTSEKALVFRYDPKSKTTRAMADFSGNEITALAEFDGGVVVAANDFEEPSTSGIKTKAAVEKAEKKKDPGEKGEKPKAESKPGADKAPASGANVTRKGARKGKGTLYRVYGDSRIEQIHALTQTYYTSVVVTEDGEVFAGAGDKGRIYMVDQRDEVATVFDVPERLVTQLLYSSSEGLSFATSDAAAFYRTDGKAKKSEYTSEAIDSKAPAHFGRIEWRSTGAIEIATRTGNTAEPGVGWSEWQKPRQITPAGGGSHSARVTSPPGRYLQLRIRFAGDRKANVRAVKLYYLPQNRPTKITEVTVEPSTKSKKPVTLEDGVTKPRSPVLKLKWKVDDEDKDTNEYRLSVRREGDALWRPISPKDEPLTKTTFDWNTETFEDGYYRLRVTASDRQTNSAARALESHKTTPLFLVDNQRPEIRGLSIKVPNVSLRASDSMSPISEASFSVDERPWQLGDTQDGLFDELTEMIRITLPDDLAPGIHSLTIRVADEAGNIGSTTASFRTD